MTASYPTAMKRLLAGEPLGRQLAEEVMQDMMAGRLEPVPIAALLSALATRGVDTEELTGFALAMRGAATSVAAPSPLMDTCGTGGSGLPTANTSTMAAFVLAAAGANVAKHGNRASSGKCGSMDVLEALGVRIDLPPAAAERLLAERSLAFLFAPLHHPAMKYVMPVRRQLGFRTVFNLLGPLANPAGADHQLLGVSDPERAPAMAETLRALGCRRALVVWGEDGLDELTLCAATRLWQVTPDGVEAARLTPEDLGLERVPFEAIAGGERETNLALFQSVLSGEERGPRRDHLLLNAGAAIHVAGLSDDIAAGIARADELIGSGAAWAAFEGYRDASQQAAEATA